MPDYNDIQIVGKGRGMFRDNVLQKQSVENFIETNWKLNKNLKGAYGNLFHSISLSLVTYRTYPCINWPFAT